jgi:hypothetical protein
MDMTDAIERFQQSLPGELQGKLDYSPESLQAFEGFALAQYPSIEDAKRGKEAIALDAMARYVGEVFRKRLGGKWMIDYSDRENAFYGLPQLTGMTGQNAQICPLTLVTASLDRRTGKFLRKVFDNSLRDAGLARGDGKI